MSEAIASFAVWSGCRPPKRKTPSGRTASARGWSRSAPPMSTASAPFLRPRGSTITGRRRPRPKSGSRLCERAGAKRCHHACWPCSAARWIASNWFQRQIKEVEAAREAVFHVQPVVGETPCEIRALAKLRGIGPEFATVLATEVFHRRFENRRQLAAFVGLTPSPYMSGDLRRDQGISKAGSPMVRATMLELAWVWLMHQKQSRLARWFAERVGVARGRVRRIAIVALARKLLVALWRDAETGLVPEGAALKVT